MEIRLVRVGQLVARCWEDAERATGVAVAEKYPAPDEEQVTFLFGGELRTTVALASQARRFEYALLADLRTTIRDLASADAAKLTTGLIARVNLHRRHHEGRHSASDLGLVMTRPVVHLVSSATRIETRRDHAQALLAQAKLGRRSDHADGAFTWGRLTKAQERLLPERSEYGSLLLYRLEGKTASELRPFRWQLCRGHTVPEIKSWLRSDAFPDELSSSDVIGKLVARVVGTDDSSIIGTIIDPEVSSLKVIEIRVFWPDGSGPADTLSLRRRAAEIRKMKVIQGCGGLPPGTDVGVLASEGLFSAQCALGLCPMRDKLSTRPGRLHNRRHHNRSAWPKEAVADQVHGVSSVDGQAHLLRPFQDDLGLALVELHLTADPNALALPSPGPWGRGCGCLGRPQQ